MGYENVKVGDKVEIDFCTLYSPIEICDVIKVTNKFIVIKDKIGIEYKYRKNNGEGVRTISYIKKKIE